MHEFFTLTHLLQLVKKDYHYIKMRGQKKIKIRKSMFQKITEYKFWVKYSSRVLQQIVQCFHTVE